MNDRKLYEVADLLRTVSGNQKKRRTVAVVVAAGSSTRMGKGTPKQFRALCGLPVVVRTLLAFEEASTVSEIIVVCREGDEEIYNTYKETYGITKLSGCVKGGATRQESVLSGVETLEGRADYVAITDAARPLITPEQIDVICMNAYRTGAATAACRVYDTVKSVSSKRIIEETLDRDRIMLAQTPQVFAYNLYCAAAYTATEAGFSATDDNSLVERIGYAVTAVDCGRENIKLTEPIDFIIAEAILSQRSEKK